MTTTSATTCPEGGVLAFDFTHLWPGERSEHRVTTYTPADETTAAALDRYVGPQPA